MQMRRSVEYVIIIRLGFATGLNKNIVIIYDSSRQTRAITLFKRLFIWKPD